ncbi:MAG TPA: peroxiredoxin-like family protein [Thermoanaerobaculia bacterium]|nr:peroxiredoxin-like family protein [Thermoanaerobaculia bacterium]
MFCREQAVQVHRERDTIQERGVELVFIGNGNRHSAEAFQKQFDIQAPLYVDTKCDAYRALSMRRGARDIINLSSLRNMTRSLRAGFRPGLIQGDGRQFGGVVVVRPGGQVLYSYLSSAGGDHPPVADILRAL